MRLFLELLYRYRNLLLFLFLEAIAAGILLRFNAEQHAAFEQFMLAITGNVNAVKKDVYSYTRLGAVNRELSADIKILRRKLDRMQAQLNRRKGQSPNNSYAGDSLPESSLTMACDTLQELKRYHYIPCRAVDNTIRSSYNHIIVNVGSEDGAKTEMGIVSPQGVAGMLTYVSEHYSLGMSMLNKKMKLSAKIKSSGITGTVTWQGGNTRYGSLEYVPLHYEPQVGDTVITSNFSTIFPEGYRIGTIATVDDVGKKGFFDIQVELATAFNKLDYLYLVQSYDKQEIDSLRSIAESQ
jgi:rod shape-determining protein MreC